MRWAETSPEAGAGLTSVSQHLHSRQEGLSTAFSRLPYVDRHMDPTSSAILEQMAAGTWFWSVQIREQEAEQWCIYSTQQVTVDSQPHAKSCARYCGGDKCSSGLHWVPCQAPGYTDPPAKSASSLCGILSTAALPSKRMSELPGLRAFFPYVSSGKMNLGLLHKGSCSEPVRAFRGKQDLSYPRILPVVPGSVSRWDGEG